MRVTREGYGGFLPLELNEGEGLFDSYPREMVTAYNSGKTALYAAILSLGCKRVFVPYFYCPSVWESFRLEMFSGFEFIPYYIGADLLPLSLDMRDDDALILVNYYGIMDKQISDFVEDRTNVIIDNAQAYFCPPVIREGILNIYSCRKFVGVSDGGYVIGPSQVHPELERSISSGSMGHILGSLELGTNAFYSVNLENERKLCREFKLMSVITEAILENADYEMIRSKRMENFAYLHSRLNAFQNMDMAGRSSHAYCYPLLLIKDYRQRLIEKKIYIPTLWKELISPEFSGKIEYDMSANCLCLPIDQRYDSSDMDYISDTVLDIIKEDT